MSVDLAQLDTISHELLGQAPDRIDRPGGKSRDSVRAWFGERSLIITHRKHEQRARLEALVLRALTRSAANVPRLIAWRGHWLVQQDLGQQRLTQALDQASPEQVADRLNAAVTALVHCQRGARELDLARHLPRLGEKESWFGKLFGRAAAVSDWLGLASPVIPGELLMQQLRLRTPEFVKWDARPGNAVVGAGSDVFWIDWEHCGCRNALDDLVWLLADEYTPDDAGYEEQLLATWLVPVSNGWSAAEAADYFYSYGVLHSLVRLHALLRLKGDGAWWDHGQCLELDQVGVTRAHALRLLGRVRRWAARTSHLQGLGPWLAEVAAAIPER